jgi:hypothetical protein
MAYMLNGCNTGGLPEHLVKPLVEKYDIPFFVETGTAGGMSVRVAAKLFKKCYTIEIVTDRPDIENAPSNVDFLFGDSAELLPEIISELLILKGDKEKQYVLFYLDAHYSGDTPNESGHPECPVLDEIKCIAEYGEDAIIIIDDARLFFGRPPYPHNPSEWPSICEIFWRLSNSFPYHHITITDDYVLAIPVHVREVIDKEWAERFNIRYPNDKDKLRGQVKDVYEAFIKDVYEPFMDYIK